jgi:tRNA(fMet)-specific endonuclease VapC
MGLILDSTFFIHAERMKETPLQLIAGLGERFGDVELSLSVMSAGELFHGCWRATDPRRRAQREEFVESILAAVPVLPINLPIMRIFGEIDALLRSKGRTLPTSDLLIGCTALSRGDEVLTGNPRHFRSIPGLKVHRQN